MKKFTNYIATKYAKKDLPEIKNIDLKTLDITPDELRNKLDVSTSTANNWYVQRTPISKMGKLAIKYAIQQEMFDIYQTIRNKNNLLIDDNKYKIMSNNLDNGFDIIAQTNQPKVARTLEYINVIYGFMQSYYDYLLKNSSNKDHQTEILNVLDMIFYLETGSFYSQEYEKHNRNLDITTSFDEIFNNPTMCEIRVKVCQQFNNN